jgi:pimeloyl-ACP methyl ester carboxylesterase
VDAFVKHHALEKVTVLGHSFGGRVALMYAGSYTAERLVLYNTSNPNTPSLFRALNAFAANVLAYLAPQFLWHVHTTMLKPRSYSNHVGLTKNEITRMLETFILTHKTLRQPPTTLHTKSVLCIAGTRDRIVDPRATHHYAATLPHATLATLDGGHFAHIDNPEGFCRVLEKFCTPEPV